jgi:hypothetical protein
MDTLAYLPYAFGSNWIQTVWIAGERVWFLYWFCFLVFWASTSSVINNSRPCND